MENVTSKLSLIIFNTRVPNQKYYDFDDYGNLKDISTYAQYHYARVMVYLPATTKSKEFDNIQTVVLKQPNSDLVWLTVNKYGEVLTVLASNDNADSWDDLKTPPYAGKFIWDKDNLKEGDEVYMYDPSLTHIEHFNNYKKLPGNVVAWTE